MIIEATTCITHSDCSSSTCTAAYATHGDVLTST